MTDLVAYSRCAARDQHPKTWRCATVGWALIDDSRGVMKSRVPLGPVAAAASIVGSTFNAYGGKSLHQQSHGEAFLALFQHRFEDGIYLLDEPEAALSP